MELFSLSYFKTVADVGNLTRAAEILSMSPSSLSASIKKLENELGVELFDRKGRNIVLNEYGKTYLTYVDKILKLSSQGEKCIRQMLAERESCVSIADMTNIFASHFISDFLRQNPDVNIRRSYINQSGNDFIDMKSNFDFIIGSGNIVARDDLTHILIRSSHSTVAIMNKSNAYAGRSSLKLSEIKNEPMLSFGEGTACRKMLETIFSEIGATPNIVFESNSPPAMIPALNRDLGFFIQSLQASIFNMPIYENCVAVPISDCHYWANTALFWDPERDLSAEAKRFKAFCLEYSKSHCLIES